MSFAIEPAPVVIDASIAVDLALGEGADLPTAVRRWVGEDRMLLAPAVYWTEVGHALLRRSGRDSIEASRRLGSLEAIGLETVDRGAPGVRMALALAERHGLSVYDATYLWLAIDVDGELATLDRLLARAAVAEGVPLALELSAG
ncbi:MAG: type II toxin-antitoxin system VapC family toxin [Chloroflexi bacterium]|nr:type II toxin-antitoxin system VapC family toxin [Chloroflexota bacterium]